MRPLLSGSQTGDTDFAVTNSGYHRGWESQDFCRRPGGGVTAAFTNSARLVA